jgi:ribosomal protein L33
MDLKNKIFCEKCDGLGYRTLWSDHTETKKIHLDCADCDSKGYIEKDDREDESLFGV